MSSDARCSLAGKPGSNQRPDRSAAVLEQPSAPVLKSLASSEHDFEYPEFKRGHDSSRLHDLLSPVRSWKTTKARLGCR